LGKELLLLSSSLLHYYYYYYYYYYLTAIGFTPGGSRCGDMDWIELSQDRDR
jgi:hypothetical protein